MGHRLQGCAGVNIVFVERDFGRRGIIKDMLTGSGATLVEIGGATGLPEIADLPMALAIVEVEGGGEGMAAIVRLRAREAGPPPIIALVSEADLTGPTMAAGADEVLIEPVSMIALFDAIGRHLQLS